MEHLTPTDPRKDSRLNQTFNAGPFADPEERRAVFAVLDSFRQYRHRTHYNTTHRRRQNFYALPKKQQNVLAAPPFNLLDNFSAVDDAIDDNADIADAILQLGLRMFDIPEQVAKDDIMKWHNAAKPNDLAQAHSTIRQFWRDWSVTGFTAEVQPLLNIILSDLARTTPLLRLHRDNESLSHQPADSSTRDLTLLLPGAGLGRLMFELCLEGYNVEGNEISYHQLLASNFILNSLQPEQKFKLYPFATTFTNHINRADQMKEVLIPDIHPGTAMAKRLTTAQEDAAILPPGSMNMAAGDFLTAYSDEASKDSFDGVVTVYFIDTAPNLMRYIETIHNCLKSDGIWINIGPLLWHFDDRVQGKSDNDSTENGDMSFATDDNDKNLPSNPKETIEDTGVGEPGSVELTEDEVLALVGQMGFEILQHEFLPPDRGRYIQDPASMMQSRYRCSHWVARKL